MTSNHLISDTLEKTFRVGTQKFGLFFMPYFISHVGKNNHKLNLTFSVESSDSSDDIMFFILNEQEFIDSFSSYVGNLANNTYRTPKDSPFFIRTTNYSYEIPVKDNGMIYLIFDNTHSTFTRKNIHLLISEEWDENIQPSNFVSIVPPENVSLKTEIETMIDESNESLYIISPYVDTLLINKLLQKFNQGIDVKIILTTEKVDGISKDGLTQIRKYFPHNHKIVPNTHARILIQDQISILLSSADMNQKSLQVQYNAGIRMSDPFIIKKTLDFFELLWKKDSKK